MNEPISPPAYTRSVQDAEHVLKLAKFQLEDVHPVTQVFHFPTIEETNSSKTGIKIMDVDEEFINKLEQGERFVFRGTGQEKLVLCSEAETYEVKEAEISNTLAFVPNLMYGQQVACYPSSDHALTLLNKPIAAIKHSYLELRPTFPKVGKLRQLLSSTVYKGPDEEEGAERGFYFCDLLDNVQCSKEQLQSALNEMSACRIDNRWRLLEVEYESRILSQIINLSEESLVLKRSDLCSVLQTSVPFEILQHIFKHFTQPVNSDSEDEREWVKVKVCRCFAEMLLRAGQGKFRYEDFLMAWAQCLPKGMDVDVSSLSGLAIIEDQSSTQKVVHLYPEYDLPENVAERFRLLFQKKEKWTLQEIEPYIIKLTTSSMNVSTMLTKYSRPSTLRGVRVFGTRLK